MPRTVQFPEGRQIALTWSIPESFGGLTTAMLRRSRAFRTLGGTDVSVFTLDPRENRVRRDQVLAEREALIGGVTVGNLYDWLREHPLPGGGLYLDREVFTPIEPGQGLDERDTEDGPVRRRIRHNDAGDVMQIDHLRADGTLVLSDRYDSTEPGTKSGRSLVLCDETGAPVRSWRKVWHLYTAWLDRFTAKKPSFLIVDSKVVAKFVLTYRREHVTTIHVVHGSHLNDGPEPVRISRREVFARLSDFDAVVFPTNGQRADVRAIVGPEPRLFTVPNSLPDPMPSADSGRTGAAMVARLEPLKQVDQAIEAVQRANTTLAPPVTLDVYGDGPLRAELEERTSGDPNVRLNGFTTDVTERLAQASVLLLTSRSEAFALAIGEAMAAGCLPIAYDISYGPSDFIDHGKNGWLVAKDDVAALSAALVDASRLPERRLTAMRRSARKRAADFTEARVIEIWARVLREAAGHAPVEPRGFLSRLRR